MLNDRRHHCSKCFSKNLYVENISTAELRKKKEKAKKKRRKKKKAEAEQTPKRIGHNTSNKFTARSFFRKREKKTKKRSRNIKQKGIYIYIYIPQIKSLLAPSTR